MCVAPKRDDFFFRDDPREPHAERRTEILKKHPEIKQLFGYEPRTKYIVVATVALQIAMAALVRNWSLWKFVAAAYVVGATANHSLFLAIHELSHNLGAKTPTANKAIAFVANLPICIAYSVTFKPYHMAHHRYQGEEGVDTDIPTWIEGYLVTTTARNYVDHTLRKAAFLFCQILFYALRPMIVKPNLVPKDKWIVANWIVVLAFDLVILSTLGPWAIAYFLLSTFLAGSIHPTAGHFIAEHYVFQGRAETYSYYGPLNALAYNVGYHNEHHDFPSIPWSNLPKVRKIAPEYYADLPQCPSWPGTLLRFIFDDDISPFSRVKSQKSSPATTSKATK